ncbi:MAG: 1-acyl-sn-glycerol-3-phosphate acyltransferase [Sphingobacteriia bacterium]|nr:MAG: 1-acyl-sn-glycerol-3-phosphate acyltransferase [Sphingobacteriia bacterium]
MAAQLVHHPLYHPSYSLGQKIFARIWAFWGLVSFVISFLVIILPAYLTSFVPDPKGMSLFIKVSKIWMRFWLNIVACPVRVVGKNHFVRGTTYVVTCNHNALLDVPLSSPFIPGANKTIAKKDFVRIPLFGWFYQRGSVIVDRDSDASRRKSFEGMKNALEKGFHMCIYPEGTRNKTAAPLKKFYEGAFRLATDTGHDIIPAVILNTRKALPATQSFFFLPQKLEIHFLAPISSQNKSAETLMAQVYATMQAYYCQHMGLDLPAN